MNKRMWQSIVLPRIDMKKIPVTIITGALGSGKTTLVNHILTSEHGSRIGVVVNEFGELGIDGDLILASKEKLIELPNGCICCEVREDLIGALGEISKKDVDAILIETSGLAEVVPAAVTLELPQLSEKLVLDGIVCVVDTINFDENLARNKTALEQIQASDLLVLSKVDIVDKKKLETIKSNISKLSKAGVIEAVKGKVEVSLLLDLSHTKKFREWKRSEHKHAHDSSIESASIKVGPVDSDKIQEFFETIARGIFRAKGIVCVKESAPNAGDELRMVFQKVGKRWEMEFSRPFEPKEERKTKIVFIGNDFDKNKLESELRKCQ